MKISRATIVIAILMVCQAAYAQLPKVTWGTETSINNANYLSDYLGCDGKYHYFVSTTYKSDFWGPGSFETGIYIEKYNLQMGLVKKSALSMPDLPGALYSRSFILDGVINMVLIVDGVEEDKIYHVKLNSSTLVKEGAPRQIATYSSTSKMDYSTLDLRFSPDSSKILMSRREKPGLRGAAIAFIPIVVKGKSANDNITLEPIVFDRSMNEVWKREISLPYKNENYTIEDIYINNAGNAWITGKYYLTKEEKKKDKYTMEVFHVADKGTRITKSSIGNSSYEPIEFRILSGNDALKIMGICRNKIYTKGISDVFYQEVNPVDGSTVSFKTFGFSSTILKNCYTSSKGVNLYDTHEITNILKPKNGGYTLFLNNRYSEASSLGTKENSKNEIIINFTDDIDTIWSTYYEKNTWSYGTSIEDHEYSVSFPVYDNSNGKIHIINNGNVGKTWDDVLYINFDKNGNASEPISLFELGKKLDKLYTKMCIQISDKQAIILTMSRNSYKYGLITYP